MEQYFDEESNTLQLSNLVDKMGLILQEIETEKAKEQDNKQEDDLITNMIKMAKIISSTLQDIQLP